MSVESTIPQEALYGENNEDLLLKTDSSLMGHLPLTAIFTSFFFWANLYFYICVFNRHCSPEWNCRIVTAIHGLVATILCGTCWIVGPWPFTYIAQPNTQFHTTIITISMGYFIFDFIWCTWYQTEGLVMFAHHVVSMIGFTYGLYTGMYGSELTAVLGGSEASNPFLQTRWFLKETGRYKDGVAKAIDYMFVAVYMFVRLGVGTALHFTVQTHPKLDLVPILGGNAFYIISVIFGVQIMKFFIGKYVLKKKPKNTNRNIQVKKD